ncbi:hypothetical protein I3V78_00955 [Archangium primigenium]|nr:hypothetical protein [Archangium primigenium]
MPNSGIDSSSSSACSHRTPSPGAAAPARNEVVPTAATSPWEAPRTPRQEMAALLRHAAFLLNPDHWGSGPANTESPAFAEVREHFQRALSQPPFHTAPAAAWRGLVELAISYSAYTFRPPREVKREEAEALVTWFACFWKLDDLVDADREALPAGYLPELRRLLAQAWWGDETDAPAEADAREDRQAFASQAVALLMDHRRQLRALGFPLEHHPRYQRAVWDHIQSQTGEVPRVDSLAEYFGVRRVRGGMECVFLMYLALQGVEWRDEFERIVDVANVVTCMTDDLFSAPRDAREGVVGAVALCGSERSLLTVRSLHHELLDRLTRLVAFDDGPSTRLFVRTVLDVVLGMLDWQSRNPRYREGARWLADLLHSGAPANAGADSSEH